MKFVERKVELQKKNVSPERSLAAAVGFRDAEFQEPDVKCWKRIGGHHGRWEMGSFIGGSGQYTFAKTRVERIWDREDVPIKERHLEMEIRDNKRTVYEGHVANMAQVAK